MVELWQFVLRSSCGEGLGVCVRAEGARASETNAVSR